METAEIIKALRGYAQSMSLATDNLAVGFDVEDAVIIEAAIAALAPEPVTEDGLRACGFESSFGTMIRSVGSDYRIVWTGSEFVLDLIADRKWHQSPLHIPHMHRLREVIASLEGKE